MVRADRSSREQRRAMRTLLDDSDVFLMHSQEALASKLWILPSALTPLALRFTKAKTHSVKAFGAWRNGV